jgi:Cu-processing system permease protein
MTALSTQISLTFKWALRDRLFHAVIGVALIMFLLVPALSIFSMRQVQELAITISLSSISLVLLVLATLLGTSSIWRDIERRYTASVLALPLSRTTYVLGKFCGIALFISMCAALMGIVASVVILIVSAHFPSDISVHWQNIWAAIIADILKYLLVAAMALFFSSLSTSFFLPFFGTIALYLAGSASQEVFEYISGEFGRTLPATAFFLIKGVYYVIPNFAAFNLKVQAIYGLPLPYNGLFLTLLYFMLYIAILLFLSVSIFSRRQIP